MFPDRVNGGKKLKFRPCIDIHNGHVVQIVGGTLKDADDSAKTNFTSEKDSIYYADMFYELGLYGGHAILLNGKDSPYYEATKEEVIKALARHKGLLQIGGGITDENAKEYIEAGASHIIVTSYIFENRQISFERLEKLRNAVGKEHIVLDLSCRINNEDGKYYVTMNRWQTFTDAVFEEELLVKLSEYCDEFLVHAVDSEGKKQGIDENVLAILAKSSVPVTYAGGIANFNDIDIIRNKGLSKVDFTIGSALDIYGGTLSLPEVIKCIQ